MIANKKSLFWLVLFFISASTYGQIVNTTPVNLVGSSDPIPGPGAFIMHPFTPSPLTGTYHGGTFYGATKEKWGYNISGLTPGDTYTLTVYYMMDVVQLVPGVSRIGNLSLLSGAPLDVTTIPYVPPINWRIWYTLSTTFTAVGTTDRIDIEADGITDNSLWLFTDIAIDGSGECDDLTVTVSSSEICIGDSFTLDATSDNGGVITWDGGVDNGVPFTPVAAGTMTVEATSTSPDDCAYSIDILVNDLPTVTANADDESVCEGDEVILTGGGADTYVWDAGVVDGVAFTPVATATYTVEGTDVNGCVNTADVTVVILPPPTIDAGLDEMICYGSDVTLSGSGAGVGGVYVWDGGITDGVAFTPLVTGDYTVTGTDADGCENTDVVTVVVAAEVPVDAGADINICEGEPVTLTGSGAGAGGTYTWDGGVIDGVEFTPLVTTTYTVIGTNAGGCEGTDEVTVNVVPAPPVNAGADVAICIGETVTLTGTGAGAGATYTWDGGITDATAFSPVATAIYTVTGTDVDGCFNTDDVTVTVNPLPIINAGADRTICAGDLVVLTGAGAGIGGTYTWDGGVTNSLAFAPAATTTYTVTGTNTNGCVGTDNVTITVVPLPVVGFTADQYAGCAPYPVNFSASVFGAVTYEWKFGDGTEGDGAPIIHVYNNDGVFDVTLTVTNADGCVSTETYSNYITVVPQPIADFTYTIDESSEVHNLVSFHNESRYANEYEWSFGDGSPNVNTVNPIHDYEVTSRRSYDVVLTATNDYGCVDDTTYRITIKEKLLYYIPNAFTPDGDLVNNTFKPIFISGLDLYDYHLVIFNRWGEIVFESYDATVGWNGAFGPDGLVEDGTYVWRIEFGETMSDKLHKETGHVTILK